MEQDKLSGTLAAELDTCVKDSIGHFIGGLGIVDAFCSADRGIAFRASNLMHGYSERIKHAINNDEHYSKVERKMIRSGNALIGCYPDFIAIPLLIRAIEARSAGSALGWLDRVLATNNATGKIYHVVGGLDVAESIELSPDYALYPIGQVLSTGDRLRLKYRRSASEWVQTIFGMQKPNSLAVLSLNVNVEPVLVSSGGNYTNNSTESISINDICLLLSMLASNAIFDMINWFEYDSDELQSACGFQAMASSFPEILPKQAISKSSNLDNPQEYISRFAQLASTDKNRIRYAMHRVRQAMLRHSEGDCAVELSIAFEAMLTERSESNSEMTHKIALRAARYLEFGIEKRCEVFEIVKGVYKIRSRVVHGDDTRNIKDVSEIVRKASILCASLVKRLITSGTIPSWKDFDLS